MGIREELIKAIEGMGEEELEAVWDYVRLLREPEEAGSTAEERKAIAGRNTTGASMSSGTI